MFKESDWQRIEYSVLLLDVQFILSGAALSSLECSSARTLTFQQADWILAGLIDYPFAVYTVKSALAYIRIGTVYHRFRGKEWHPTCVRELNDEEFC